MTEAFHQPAAEKPGSAGEKQSLPTQLFPQPLGMINDQIKIGAKMIHDEDFQRLLVGGFHQRRPIEISIQTTLVDRLSK